MSRKIMITPVMNGFTVHEVNEVAPNCAPLDPEIFVFANLDDLIEAVKNVYEDHEDDFETLK